MSPRARTLPEPTRSEYGSGLRVITEEMPGTRSVAFAFWVGIGSRAERPAIAGSSHFLEHLLFKGTKTRTARQIAEAFDAVGGDLNAFSAKEYTCYYCRVLDRDRDRRPQEAGPGAPAESGLSGGSSGSGGSGSGGDE